MSAVGKVIPLMERIESKIIPEPNSGCWIWLGAVNCWGYGQLNMRGRGTSLVHRILYEQKYGPIPAGLECDHLCRVRCCVNPDHIEPVTKRVNMERGNSPSMRQARQTHCKNGHPFDQENTLLYRTKWGFGRKCKICHAQYLIDNRERIAERMRIYHLKRKETK